MLLPALSKAREKARAMSCINNLKQHMLGMQGYWTDYEAAIKHQDPSGWTWPRYMREYKYLPTNIKNLSCDSNPKNTADERTSRGVHFSTYLYNDLLNSKNGYGGKYFYAKGWGGGYASRQLVFAEASLTFNNVNALVINDKTDGAGGGGFNGATYANPGQQYVFPHNQLINIAYADGHAIGKKDVTRGTSGDNYITEEIITFYYFNP